MSRVEAPHLHTQEQLSEEPLARVENGLQYPEFTTARFTPTTFIRTPEYARQYYPDNTLLTPEYIQRKYGPLELAQKSPQLNHLFVSGLMAESAVGVSRRELDIVFDLRSHLPPDSSQWRTAVRVREYLHEIEFESEDKEISPNNTRTILAECPTLSLAWWMLYQKMENDDKSEVRNVLMTADETDYRSTLHPPPVIDRSDFLFADRGTAWQFDLIPSDIDPEKEGLQGIQILNARFRYEGDPNKLLVMRVPNEDELDDPFITAYPAPSAEHFGMNGPELIPYFEKTRITKAYMEEVLEEAGISKEELNFVAGHQASIRPVTNVNNLFPDQDYPNIRYKGTGIRKYGNTGTVSSMLDIEDGILNGLIRSGDVGINITYGGGLSYGASVLRIHF